MLHVNDFSALEVSEFSSFFPHFIRKPLAGWAVYSGVAGKDVGPPPPFVFVVISWQQESRLSRLSLPLFFPPSCISPQSTPA